MKQLVRRVIDKKGVIAIEDVPTPHIGDNQVLVAVRYSLISSGTELGTVTKDPVEMAKLTLSDPWMRNAVKDLVFSGGMTRTYDTIINEFFLFRMLGYSGAGTVLEVGHKITDLKPGDQVAFAAQGHAEQVAPYANHVVKVPDGVELKHAAFVTVGGIALQGVRRTACQLGDWVLVYGLGLVGQLTAQLLLAAGAKVIGIDINASRIDLVKSTGLRYAVNASLEDPVHAVMRMTGGKGADKTVICAVSNKPDIANNALKMTRKQGRVVFVGIVKMDLERKPFFLNELDLAFSRAYGPGSYDDAYEKGRVDYPYQYIRWTEKRNLAEVLRLIEDDRLKIGPLIDSIYPLKQAQTAFDAIQAGDMKSVAMLLSYGKNKDITPTIHLQRSPKPLDKATINVGIIGVGNFTRNVHIPNFSRTKGFHLKALCSASGLNAASMSDRYPVDYITSEYAEILNDPNIDLVVIATRHNLHAKIAIEAANAGKHIFVEKPVAMTLEDLAAVQQAVTEAGVHFMVGYNRRYSHIAQRTRNSITQWPIMMRYTVNIQHLPDSHWTLDPEEGGGRLLGEADHFFDLLNFFANSRPVDIQAQAFPNTEDSKEGLFNFMVQVRYENNSLGHVTYTSLGGPKLPREHIELFCGDRHIEISGFKKLLVNGKVKSLKSDMGHLKELQHLYQTLKSEIASKVQNDTYFATWISLKAEEMLRRTS